MGAGPLASWGERVGGLLLDLAIWLGPFIVLGLLAQTSDFFGWLALAWIFGGWGWFQWLNGVTGQSPGKALIGLKLVSVSTREPIGGGMSLLRWGVAWALNVCCIGSVLDYLWPLWDETNQTLHDKAANSVVVSGQPRKSGMNIFKVA